MQQSAIVQLVKQASSLNLSSPPQQLKNNSKYFTILCFVSSFIRHNVGPWSLYFSPTHTKFHKKIDSLYFTLFKYSLHIGEPTMTEPWLVKMGDVMSIYTLYWLHCPVGSAVRQYQTWVKCTPSLFRGGVLLTLWKYPF